MNTVEIIEKYELAKRLKFCKRQVELMVNAGVIPAIKLGRAVRFDYHEVIEAIKNHPDIEGALREKREEMEKRYAENKARRETTTTPAR